MQEISNKLNTFFIYSLAMRKRQRKRQNNTNSTINSFPKTMNCGYITIRSRTVQHRYRTTTEHRHAAERS